MIVIRPATREDALWLSSRLRSEDHQEIVTATGKSPEEILPLSFAMSEECYTARRVVDGRVAVNPVAIFGVTPCPVYPGHKGIVWFLGTDEVRLCALSVLRESGAWLNHMSRRYSQGLYNFADKRNSLHVRWCQLTGFTLEKPVLIGGHPFYPIHRPQCVTP